LAIIAGDGIGPEVVGEALKVLDAVVPGVEKTSYDLGARRYHATGEVLRLSALRGLFSAVIEDPVTFVNAPALAAERGVEADISTATESPNHRSVVDVRAVYSDGTVANVSGALSGPQLVEKIVQINGRNFDLRAEGVYLIANYIDQPGTLGKIGTLLGTADINIHAAQLSEDAEGPGATILLRIDRDVPSDVRAAITEAVGAKMLEVVDLT